MDETAHVAVQQEHSPSSDLRPNTGALVREPHPRGAGSGGTEHKHRTRGEEGCAEGRAAAAGREGGPEAAEGPGRTHGLLQNGGQTASQKGGGREVTRPLPAKRLPGRPVLYFETVFLLWLKPSVLTGRALGCFGPRGREGKPQRKRG